jgi:outer membrane protein
MIFNANGNIGKQRIITSNAAVVFILIVFSGSARLVVAQDTVAASQKLTLAIAVDLALKQNLDLQAANIETAARQQEKVIARADLLPHASLEADNSVNRHNIRALIGTQIRIVPQSIGPYGVVHVGPTFSLPIFDLTLIREYQESGHRLLATRAEEQTVREETALLTVSQYMAHLRALASITASQSRVALAERLARQADDLLTDGVASKIDVSRAQVRLREERQRLIDAERDAKTTLYALKRILNIPDSSQIEFRDNQYFFSTPSLDVADPLWTALERRPELHSSSEYIKTAELAHQAAVAQSLPKLNFDGYWDLQGGTFASATPGYQYLVSIRIPIFTGGRLSAERKRTALLEQQTRIQLAQERNRVTEQVRDGQVELEAARTQVELGHQQVALANEEVSFSQARFQSGVADNIEVTTAQDSLARANDAEIGALFRYNIARAQLARAVGRTEQTYNH